LRRARAKWPAGDDGDYDEDDEQENDTEGAFSPARRNARLIASNMAILLA
jgi:hypothetical protein